MKLMGVNVDKIMYPFHEALAGFDKGMVVLTQEVIKLRKVNEEILDELRKAK